MQAIAALWLALAVFVPEHHWVPITSGSQPIGWKFLFADPERPQTLYANLGNTSLAISRDGGKAWQTIPFAPLFVLNAAISTKPQRTLVVLTSTEGGSGPPVFRLHISRNDALSWTTAEIHSPQTGTIQGPLAIDAADANTVYVGLDQCLGSCHGGVIRSRDGGQTWSATPLTDNTVDQLESDPLTPGVVYALATDMMGAQSLYRSTDFGASWKTLQTGTFITFAIDPSSPSTIYARTSALQRSNDRGDHWSIVVVPFAAPFVGDAIAIDPAAPGTIVWTTSFGAGAVLSRDSGMTWLDISEGLSNRGLELSDVVFTRDGTLFGRSSSSGVVQWLPVARRRAVR